MGARRHDINSILIETTHFEDKAIKIIGSHSGGDQRGNSQDFDGRKDRKVDEIVDHKKEFGALVEGQQIQEDILIVVAGFRTNLVDIRELVGEAVEPLEFLDEALEEEVRVVHCEVWILYPEDRLMIPLIDALLCE